MILYQVHLGSHPVRKTLSHSALQLDLFIQNFREDILDSLLAAERITYFPCYKQEDILASSLEAGRVS